MQLQTLLVTFLISQLPIKKLSKVKTQALYSFIIIPNKESNNNAYFSVYWNRPNYLEESRDFCGDPKNAAVLEPIIGTEAKELKSND